MDNRPIGVFDSGLGGLTGVRELRKRLPHEDIIYFGDTGRVPYGSRSPETILQYARQDVAFLLSKNVKCIMAACANKEYGRTDHGKGAKYNVEFVSANPTGPMHMGNACLLYTSPSPRDS